MKKDTRLKESGVAEILLSYKPSLNLIKQPKITCSKDAFNVFRDKWDPNLIEFVEQFKVMLLTRANNVIGIVDVSKGTVCSTVVDPKIIIAAAINSNACSIILCHNHPSGNLQPSKADEEITRKIKEAAKFFDLSVMDHLVISKSGYFSFAEEGLC
jgi:DNA repair protein RadC